MNSPDEPGTVRHSATVARQPVTAGTATEVQVLVGPADGATSFSMRRFIMGEGGGMPRHTNEVEHQQYVLAGRARIELGRRVFEVERGAVVFIPAHVPHAYEVLQAPFEFLCIVPNAEDQMRLLTRSQDESSSP